jgi:glycosyltransferase involved in cell wall biosynthesis
MPADVDQLILVDGGSTDDTIEVAEVWWPGIEIVRQTRQGKGDALAVGFAAATSDVVVTIDADGSMDPAEIPSFVDAVEFGGADFVKGSRLLPNGGSSDLTVLRRCGNAILRGVVNWLFGTGYTDLCYGYNAIRRSELAALGFAEAPTESNRFGGDIGTGFEIETCLHIRAALARLRITEVPSFEQKRITGTSNLRVVRDGLRVLRAIATEHRRPAVRFAGNSSVEEERGSVLELAGASDLC